MSLENSSVTLSMKIAGVQTAYGSYEYHERTSNGNIIPEDQRLFVTKPSEESDCYIRVHLGESFVNHAISDEGRPRREGNFKAYTFWRRMTETERLAFHIARYAESRYVTKYTYEIHE